MPTLGHRARWPNGDPETQGLHTPPPNGWETAGAWASHSPKTPTKETKVKVTNPAGSRQGR